MKKERKLPSDKVVLKYVGVCIVLVVIFVVGFVAGRIGNGISISSVGKDMSLYWEVWNTITSQYVDKSKVDEKEMYYGAIKGMVSAIGDVATTFLDPEETDTFNKSIEGKTFEGIGAELSYENGQIVVVSPIKGSPAEKAGIKAGDVIVKVDGSEIETNDSIYDVVAKIRGTAGTKVVVTVIHKGESSSKDIEVTRGEIDVPSIEVEKKTSDITVMRVTRFTEETVFIWNENWDKAVDEVLANDPKGLILDLRGNPGGYFDCAVYAANDFLPKTTIVSKQEDKKGKQDVFRVTRTGKLLDIPLVVLVDEGSASASEILSGALLQNDRATLVGTKTYGKGTAQTIIDFSDGSTLHITILKWLLPDGTWINKENPITPDVVQEYPEVEFKKGNDVQLNKAIEILKGKIN